MVSREADNEEGLVDISDLVFRQKHGVFFVWKMSDEKMITTFLRNRTNISLEIQMENAITDGRERKWTLIGIGHWSLRPLELRNMKCRTADSDGVMFIVYNVTASLLRLKNLPEREHRSTEIGMQEMREKWIPYVCERLRKILWGSEE